MLLGILTVSLLSTVANAGNDPYSAGSFLENPILVDKNPEKLPGQNAVWKKVGVDYDGYDLYIDTNSMKLVEKNRQIYEVDTKATKQYGLTRYVRRLIGCGSTNYISPLNGHINKVFDNRGSLISSQSYGDAQSNLRSLTVFKPSHKTFVTMKATACKK